MFLETNFLLLFWYVTIFYFLCCFSFCFFCFLCCFFSFCTALFSFCVALNDKARLLITVPAFILLKVSTCSRAFLCCIFMDLIFPSNFVLFYALYSIHVLITGCTKTFCCKTFFIFTHDLLQQVQTSSENEKRGDDVEVYL